VNNVYGLSVAALNENHVAVMNAVSELFLCIND